MSSIPRPLAFLALGQLAKCTLPWVMIVATAIAQQPPPYGYGGQAAAPYPGYSQYPSGMASGRGAAFKLIPNSANYEMQFVGPFDQRGQLTYSSASGMQLALNVGIISHVGYHPVKATVRMHRPSARTRTIRVRFAAGIWSNEGRSVTAEKTFQLARGETEATAAWHVPQYEWWERCSWDIAVDRQPDDELSMDETPFPQHPSSTGLTCLLASSNPPSISLEPFLAALVGGAGAIVEPRAPDQLPLSWVDYTTFDIVALSAVELHELATREPKRAQALARWVRAGGNLWLLDCGTRWSSLLGAEAALGVQNLEPDASEPANTQRAADDRIVARGWHFVPLGERALEPAEGALVLSNFDLGKAEAASPRTPAPGVAPTPPAAASARPLSHFAARALGLGCIVAFRQGDLAPSGNPGVELSDLQQSLVMPRLTSTGRDGNNPHEFNPEFNNWLIRGVGTAPVGEFQFLITLFVLAIGPLNYWWLKRQRRLPLLILTAPVCAAVVTLLLLSYGVLADGTGVRVRARSLTLLDQSTGESVTWSRLSYYAGVKPRGGLTLPGDTVVTPILARWDTGRYNRRSSQVRRDVAWLGDEQQLRSGWLQSRTPTQYLAINARRTPKRLDLRATDNGLHVGNRLGVAVTHLAVQDHDGRLYWCESLPADAARVLKPGDALEIPGRLRQLFADHLPEFPPGAEMNSGYFAGGLSRNLMEAQIDAIKSPLIDKWSNGSYIAVTDRGAEVDLGSDEAREEGSFHLIRGAW